MRRPVPGGLSSRKLSTELSQRRLQFSPKRVSSADSRLWRQLVRVRLVLRGLRAPRRCSGIRWMQMEPAGRRLSYDDLLALPEDARGEILNGDLIVSPSPLPRHTKVQRVLGRFIGGPFEDDDGRGGPGGWWILLEPDARFDAHTIVRPDLAGWRRERLPARISTLFRVSHRGNSSVQL